MALTLPVRWLGVLPIAIGVRRFWQLRGPPDSTPLPAVKAVSAVVALTISNGGDNVADCVPLLIACGLSAVPVFVLVFAILTEVWCGLALAIVSRPAGSRLIERFGRTAVPLVMIGLGLYILTRA